MLDALISGKLIKDCQLKTSQNNKLYCQFLLSVGVGEPENIVVSAIAFGGHAERIAQLKKGDVLSVIGALKPTEWEDKATHETRHGLSITVNNVLSVYDIKRRKPEDNTTQLDRPSHSKEPAFDDPIGF